MREVLVSTEELAKITGVNPSTIRTWLCNYRFTKFITKTKIGDRYKLGMKLNKQSAYRLCDFFRERNVEYAVNNLEKYFEELENGNK